MYARWRTSSKRVQKKGRIFFIVFSLPYFLKSGQRYDFLQYKNRFLKIKNVLFSYFFQRIAF